MTPLLELVHVSRRFGNVTAVDSVSFAVQQGQFVTLLGPSGCGKTTTLRLIAGFEAPDSGSIHFKNTPLAGQGVFVPPKDRRIGMVFQDYALFPHLNVAQNVGFGLTDKQAKAARIADMLALVGLSGYDARMPFELSGGQQQRVALARALAPAPDVLLLDEPFSSLDAALRTQLRAEMRVILRQTGTTCIFVTHAQEEALSLSDLVAVMLDGRLLQIDTPEALYERPATLDVATTVGEANLIGGDAHGDVADTLLGSIRLAQPVHGPVTLVIRPEAFDLSGDGIPARVVWSEYYGHDRRIGVALGDGTTLIARADFTQPVQTGANVRLAVRGLVMAYPNA